MRARHLAFAAWLPPVLLGVVLTGCRQGATSDPPAAEEQAAKPVVQVTVAAVSRGTVRATIPITGTLAPLPNGEAKVAPLAAGRIQRILVKTGDIVAKGQVIATLESGSLLGQIQQAEAAVRADAETVLQARLNLRSQQSTQQSAVAQARVNLRVQQVALDKLQAGSRPQEIAQAAAAVTVAESALTNAQQSLTRSQTLHAEGLLARKDLEAAQTQEQTARAQVESARQALSLVRQGNRPQDIEAGRAAVQQAEEQLRAAEAQTVQNDAKAQDVRIAERQLQGAEGALRAAQSQITALTVRAPLSGTVVGRALNPGESVDVTGALATIVDLSRVRVLLNIPAAQIAAVRVGMPVDFTVDAQPGVTHRAVISVISRAVDSMTNTVQAEATAENASRQLRDDGFVRGSIVTALHANALVVPAASIVTKDGKPTVFVVGTDGVAHAKTVEIGLRDGSRVELLTPLATGESVVTTGAYELEDGTKVEVNRSAAGGIGD